MSKEFEEIKDRIEDVNKMVAGFVLDCKRAGISVPDDMNIEDIQSCPNCGRTLFPGRNFCDAICEKEWKESNDAQQPDPEHTRAGMGL